jgi:hypothetical protein
MAVPNLRPFFDQWHAERIRGRSGLGDKLLFGACAAVLLAALTATILWRLRLH